MNVSHNTSLNQEYDLALLEKLNDGELEYLIPTIVWLFGIILFGIPGNIFTLMFYRKGYLKSNYRLFIVTVATVDLLSCCVAIPLETLLLFLGYAYDDRYEPICKLSRFSNFFMSYSSGFVLVLISVERYRKVCRPLKMQISPTCAQKLRVCAVILGLFVSWPSAFVFGKATVKATVNKEEITAVMCSVSDKAKHSDIASLYLLIMFVSTVLLLILMFVLYSLVGCKIRRRAAQMSNEARTSPVREGISNISCHSTEDSNINRPTTDHTSVRNAKIDQVHFDSTNESKSGTSSNYDTCITTESDCDFSVSVTKTGHSNTTECEKSAEQPRICKKTSLKQNSPKNLKRARANQTSRVMFIITAIYVVTYIPNLTILTIESVLNDGFYDDQAFIQRAASHFFVRLYFLNCGINPLIYTLCDSNLRYAVKNSFASLKRCVCR